MKKDVVVLTILYFNEFVCGGLEDLLIDFASEKLRRVLYTRNLQEYTRNSREVVKPRIGSSNASSVPFFMHLLVVARHPSWLMSLNTQHEARGLHFQKSPMCSTLLVIFQRKCIYTCD